MFNQSKHNKPMPKPFPKVDYHPVGQRMDEDETNPRIYRPSGDADRNKKWNSLLRVGSFLASLLGLYISAQFSVDGFKFQVDEREWIGWAIAVILVVIESIWQKFGKNTTLFILALVCYAYGIITNVVGILANRGGYDGHPFSLLVPVVFGLLLEVFPEPVLAWAISGDTTSDPIGKMLERSEETTPKVARKYRQVSDDIRMRIGK